VAKVIDSGDFLELKLTIGEKIASLHKNISVKKSQLNSRKIVERPWRAGLLKGIRAPGAGIPFLLLLGTMRYRGGKDFTIIYKNKPVEVFDFNSGPYKRWIITIENNR
jgi:hypothetical protein